MADLEALEAAVDAESEGEDAVVIHETGGANAELLRRTQALTDSFQAGNLEGFPKASYQLYKSAVRRESTVLQGRGLRLSGNNCLYFLCVLEGCWAGNRSKTMIKCPRTVTSNAASHLRQAHGIISKKTRAGKSKERVTSVSIEKSKAAYQRDPVAFVRNAITLWATEHSIPIAALQSTFLRSVLDVIPGCGRNVLDKDVCRKLLLQQYLTIKSRIIDELRVAKTFFGDMPFVCVNLDLYQDPKQNKKYMAVRISWVDGVSAKLKSRLIGARHYNPSYQEKNSTMASTLLSQWYKAVVVRDFGITDDMVLGGSGDHGSDVKKVMREHCGTHGFQEWCISHMLNVCFHDAFGTCNDKVRLE
jgi:hypothetical protein